MIGSIIRNQNASLAPDQLRQKNTYIYDHAINTCVLAIALCKWKNLDYETVISLGTAALLHDIGKTKLDDKLIALKENLNDLEFTQNQKHVEFSVQFFRHYWGTPSSS